MELHCQLDPEGIRSLAKRLCGEAQFRADPVNAVLAAIRWLDEVVGNEEGQQSPHPQNAGIQQLADLIKAKGISAVATELKVGQGTLRAWVSGFYSPAKGSLEKIRSYLQTREMSSTDTIGAEHQPRESGELFGQQQLEPETSAADKQPGPAKEDGVL
jgi:hypothetical protein